MFPNAPVPKELEDFQGIKGDKQDVPAVAADLFLHVRSNDESVTYTVVDQIMEFLRPITSVSYTHLDHFMITVASEIMAILCLAKDLEDLKERFGRIVIGCNLAGDPVYVLSLIHI